MSARTARIVACMVSATMLLIAGVLLIPTRVAQATGLSRKDVVQIRRLVQREVWREVVPRRWTRVTLRLLPGDVWRAVRCKITCPVPYKERGSYEGEDLWWVETRDREDLFMYQAFVVGRKDKKWVIVAKS